MLAARHEINILLHPQVHILNHLLKLVRDVVDALAVRLLLLLLLLLRLVRHADIAVVFDQVAQFLQRRAHLLHSLVDFLSEVVAITLCSNVVFLSHIKKFASDKAFLSKGLTHLLS